MFSTWTGGPCVAGHPPHGLTGTPIHCLYQSALIVTLSRRPKCWVTVPKDIDLCDTLGRQIHPVCIAAACVLLSPPEVKLQSWAMGVGRRWASERHWREWIKDCGRWQGCHAVYLTERYWRGWGRWVVAFSSRWAALQLKYKLEAARRPHLLRVWHVNLSTTNTWTEPLCPNGVTPAFKPKLECLDCESQHYLLVFTQLPRFLVVHVCKWRCTNTQTHISFSQGWAWDEQNSIRQLLLKW